MQNLRIGILSTASIVPRFINASRQVEDCAVTAIASRDPEKAREKAALWQIPGVFLPMKSFWPLRTSTRCISP